MRGTALASSAALPTETETARGALFAPFNHAPAAPDPVPVVPDPSPTSSPTQSVADAAVHSLAMGSV